MVGMPVTELFEMLGDDEAAIAVAAFLVAYLVERKTRRKSRRCTIAK